MQIFSISLSNDSPISPEIYFNSFANEKYFEIDCTQEFFKPLKIYLRNAAGKETIKTFTFEKRRKEIKKGDAYSFIVIEKEIGSIPETLNITVQLY